MNRLPFEVARLGALIIGAFPFLVVDPAAVWMRGFAAAWMVVITMDVAVFSTLWHRPEDEHAYSLFIVMVIPLFCGAAVWCVASALFVEMVFGGGAWHARHILLFCLPAGYAFPFLVNTGPRLFSDWVARGRIIRR